MGDVKDEVPHMFQVAHAAHEDLQVAFQPVLELHSAVYVDIDRLHTAPMLPQPGKPCRVKRRLPLSSLQTSTSCSHASIIRSAACSRKLLLCGTPNDDGLMCKILHNCCYIPFGQQRVPNVALTVSRDSWDAACRPLLFIHLSGISQGLTRWHANRSFLSLPVRQVASSRCRKLAIIEKISTGSSFSDGIVLQNLSSLSSFELARDRQDMLVR